MTRDAEGRSYDASRTPSEGLLSELVKRFIETGSKGLSSETLRQLLSEMKLPRDALLQLLSQHLVSQFEETKRDLYRSFSKELRRFFGRTHFADELAAALSKLSIQVSMDIRFSPTNGKPEVKSHVRLNPEEPDATTSADGGREEQEKTL